MIKDRLAFLLALALPSLGLLAEDRDLGVFETPVALTDLDPNAYAQWVDGSETPIEPAADNDKGKLPQWVLYTKTTIPGHSGFLFGDSKADGPRYLRVGFVGEIKVGCVLTQGNVSVSVLKAGVAYPGNPGDDSQWTPAERVAGDALTKDQTSQRESFALWILPPGTTTQALRFSHAPSPTDSLRAGWLGGAYVLADRFQNIAPAALPLATSLSEKAARLNDGIRQSPSDGWENISKPDGQRAETIREKPECLTYVWPKDVTLRGIGLMTVGFGDVEVQSLAGSAKTQPSEAAETDWKTLQTVSGLRSRYPTQLETDWIDFGQDVTTRALRLRLSSVSKEGHPHLAGSAMEGKRVWLGEWLAMKPLGDAAPQPEARPAKTAAASDLIPIRFKLSEEGFVTLVIDDQNGRRVRNLVSETKFPKGDNVVWWDGTNDLGRDPDGARHGVYHIPPESVVPGTYTVRGLWRQPIVPRYEFSIYTTGNPPWSTVDHTGAWLANHTPPMAAMFVPPNQSPTGSPLVFLGCYVTEGPDGLAWVDLNGTKRGGLKWVGGNWTSAPYLARDAGNAAASNVSGYVASVWETGKKSGQLELRITPLAYADGEFQNTGKPLVREDLGARVPLDAPMGDEIGGLAVYDGIAVCSLTRKNQLLFADLKTGKVLGQIPLDSPRGLAFDADGRLLAISGHQVLRFASATNPSTLPKPETLLVAKNFAEPIGIATDPAGDILVSDQGPNHQVKIFRSDGSFLRAIGHPGPPAAGPYDPLHMNHPAGLAVDSENHLWVTENDFLPKRVSVWTLDGQLVKAFYGPGKYGGGGTLDSSGTDKFYYADESHGAMEFRLDWTKGTYELLGIYYRKSDQEMPMPFRSAAPEVAIYHDGRRYFTNCYNNSPTSGHGTAMIFQDHNGVARPAAAAGRANQWDLLKSDQFRSRWPAEIDPKGDPYKNEAFFIWSDLNGDGWAQPEEVTMEAGSSGGVTVMPDLSLCVARLNDQAVRFAPSGFTDGGAPQYDLSKPQVLAEGVAKPTSSGGDQVLVDADGEVVVTLGVKPFPQLSLCGGKGGVATWSYPSLWPGLHASHEAAQWDRAGEVIGTTRLLGGFVTPKGSESGPIWAINGNMGNIYVFTSDGLLLATLFSDFRNAPDWRMPVAVRGQDLSAISLGSENFWPTISQTSEGQVYLVDGARSSLIKLEGLETVKRLAASEVKVTGEDLKRVQARLQAAEVERQRQQGNKVLTVAMLAEAPKMDGKLGDWAQADWADIDKSGRKAWFNANTKPYDFRGALAVAGDRLYAAWNTGEPDLLKNSGEVANAPFKTGGALDVMLGTDPRAKADRRAPVAGDLRLLVTKVDGKVRALLYRPVVPGRAEKDKVPFGSPWRTITIDKVEDVSSQVQLAEDKKGGFEISVPLAALGLKPAEGLKIAGDIGVLRGDGSQTLARLYWSNKATAMVSDVPEEASLTPALWGVLQFRRQP